MKLALLLLAGVARVQPKPIDEIQIQTDPCDWLEEQVRLLADENKKDELESAEWRQ